MRDHDSAVIADLTSTHLAFRPPNRVTVAEGAQANLILAGTGGHTGPWDPRETPYMVEPVNMLASRRHEGVCFVGPARSGKACALDTPIPTPTGWVLMGDIVDGDIVLAPNGRPVRVVEAFAVQHGRPCFRVTFSDGESIVADAEHLWGVERFYWRPPNWRYEVRTTESMVTDMAVGDRGRFRYRVRNTRPVELPAAPLAIDPYLLGVWLGNGSTGQAAFTCHIADAGHFTAAFESSGHRVDGRRIVSATGERFEAGIDTHSGAPRNPFADSLRALGIHGDKSIPAVYLRGSVAQRIALLRGLMDTDGACDPRSAAVEFSTTSAAMRDGFVELARSLGFKPIAREKSTTWVYQGVRKHGSAYRITFPVHADDLVPFASPRKLARMRPSDVDVTQYRQIVAIEPIDSVPVRCIQVDSADHLFLAGRGFIPTHNTLGLLDGWFAHQIVNDPGDMLIVQMSQEKAREFSRVRIDRAIRNSGSLRALLGGLQDDNTHDKSFKNGSWLRIGWPTASQLASSDYRYVGLTDYDRMPDSIGGEGSAWFMARKRTTTFMSRGMSMVESSPGRPITDPRWRPTMQHQAPPCTGVLGIYNTSDRRRWYWRCPDCRLRFEAEPGLGLFRLPQHEELMQMVVEGDLDDIVQQFARVVCPHCGSMIEAKHKRELNGGDDKGRHGGIWLPAGCSFDSDGQVVGAGEVAEVAGYWLGGVAARYQSWRSLVSRYLIGLREYALSGSEETLRTTVNTDQSMPYLPEAMRSQIDGPSASERGEALDRFMAPDAARFLVASVDIQGGQNARFVVQVEAVGVGLERWLIDRYDIRESTRVGMGEKFAPIDPASHPEDWDVLTDRVVRSTYRTSTPGRELTVRLTVVDSGGEDGVTANAYAWFRRLREAKLQRYVRLVKGRPTPGAPMIRETFVGARHAGDKGDVPLYLLNSNPLKDAVSNLLKRQGDGPGSIHLPAAKHPTMNPGGWLPPAFYDELAAEVRDPNGTWRQIRTRNEAWDLVVYAYVGLLILGCDKWSDWGNAPDWAAPLERNSGIVLREDRRESQESTTVAAPTVARPRRSARLGRSKYLSR